MGEMARAQATDGFNASILVATYLGGYALFGALPGYWGYLLPLRLQLEVKK